MSSNLNAICPYFTMFPLDYSDGILDGLKDTENPLVMDPFCARGTTLFSARTHGMRAIGVDISPVACAITESKMSNATPEGIVELANYILSVPTDFDIPVGEFWSMMYRPEVLKDICHIRQYLIDNHDSDEEKALRGVMLGALHGGLNKGEPSYFSNQYPRTYASKPDYAIRFWKNKGYEAPFVDVISIIKRRSVRYYSDNLSHVPSTILCADSSANSTFDQLRGFSDNGVDVIVTSPPYYGMNTYIPDQWIRNWFVGGSSEVTYGIDGQISSGGKSRFVDKLRHVWKRCRDISKDSASLHIRFGAINSIESNPEEIVRRTLEDTDWSIVDISSAGLPSYNSRQANSFVKDLKSHKVELDVSCVAI